MIVVVSLKPMWSTKNPADALDINLPPPDNEDHNPATNPWVVGSSGKPASLKKDLFNYFHYILIIPSVISLTSRCEKLMKFC